MSCPFLREGRARYCHVAPLRKLILDGPGSAGAGRCDTPGYRECPLAVSEAPGNSCPHLEQIHVQYCGATGAPKLIPFSEASLSRCGGPGYRYCDLYLSMARPHSGRAAGENLYYASNHLWLDAGEGGLCQVGIDALLARTIGTADSVLFVPQRGQELPSVVLTVNGHEWTLVFPNPLRVKDVNGQLRTHPERLTADPYGAGWLLEGWAVDDQTTETLRHGAEADAWLTAEELRLTEFVHESLGRATGCAADGGVPAPGVARLMPREEASQLYQEFFAVKPDWQRRA